MCLVCVDDTILVEPKLENINKEITSLGISTKDQTHIFQLRDEGQVGNFLGIRIEKLGERKFHITQTGLVDKVFKVSTMED